MPETQLWLPHDDWSRSYVLPQLVACNIPRSGSLDDLGAWNIARGVLVELCRELPATPVSLLYDEPVQHRDRTRVAIRVTARARRRDGQDVTVIYRSERTDTDPCPDFWSVAVNGFIPASGRDVRRPSPPWIAHTAAQTLHAELGR
ncbi:hypothetical protein VA596_47465 [Amycolatopsis sp., V23-08]|uniref:Acyl-CoA thioesterase n=1 Tax=Amycolatopsis heterodermiae TaxID=3110235 RepID=A0ABU5RNZ6_9PSEU|nr:hypothetical protein [Amycolatopsis sp., V23-08]MEA5367239.1 hypothetical protein [Amycolatopsis sp., V23-08]